MFMRVVIEIIGELIRKQENKKMDFGMEK